MTDTALRPNLETAAGTIVRYTAPNGNTYVLKVTRMQRVGRGCRVVGLTPDGAEHSLPSAECALSPEDAFQFEPQVKASVKRAAMTPEEIKEQRKALRAEGKTAIIPDRTKYIKTEGHLDVGDRTAILLRGCETPEDVYAVGAEYLDATVEELQAKYGHLNNGQIRMNIGNRIRAKFRKESAN